MNSHLDRHRDTDDRRSTTAPITGARQSTIRGSNLALVARTALSASPPISRAGIAAHTSMTRATASRLVDDLVAGGVLTELAPPASIGRGRPAALLAAADSYAALGLEVNASSLAGRVIALDGTVMAERILRADHRASDPVEVLRRLDGLGSEIIAQWRTARPEATLLGVGLALPGIVSRDSGFLHHAPNLGWKNVRPADHLSVTHLPEQRLGLTVGNEADFAARAAAEISPGRPGQLRDFIFLSGEIGIGGAAVRGGVVATGHHGWAGEVGHVCVNPSGPRCRCGSTGCLELFAGRNAILDAAGLPVDTEPEVLLAAAADGNNEVLAAVDRACRALGVALAGMINLVDIHTVVLGGHLGALSDLIVPRLSEHLAERVLASGWVHISVVRGHVDPAIGATGAAFYELGRLIDQPAPWIDRFVG